MNNIVISILKNNIVIRVSLSIIYGIYNEWAWKPGFKVFNFKKYLFLINIWLVSFILSSCFFAPSMNLPLNKQTLRVSRISNVTIFLTPIDQLSVESSSAIHQQQNYRIGVNDALSISLWGHPEISTVNLANNINPGYYDYKNQPSKQVDTTYGISKPNENKADIFLVDGKGNVYLPLVGTVSVAGKTIEEARNSLTIAYKDYIVNPNINLKIAAYRSKKVFVIGEVQQSQVVPVTDIPLSLTLALELAGWVNPVTSNVNQIYVLRQRNKNSVDAYLLDAGSAAAMLYAQRFYLQDNDIVYVSTAGIAQFNRVMGQLLPTAETIWYTENSIPASIIPGINN